MLINNDLILSVSLNSFILIISLSLSKPKFNLTFKYSKTVFSQNQLSTINFLTNN